jgi:putative chitobiose transport system permease protein
MAVTPRTVVRRLLFGLFVALLLLPTLFFFFWMISLSVKPDADNLAYPPVFIPSGVTADNYRSVFDNSPFARYALNSLIVALGSTLLNVLLASLAAFPLARMRFRGSTIVFFVILATMMIPEQVIMIPVYSLLLHLGLLNTLAGVVLPTGISAFGVFLMRQSYR